MNTDMTLEQALVELYRIGDTSLLGDSHGWAANLVIAGNVAGVNANVWVYRSATPLKAALECLAKVEAMRASIKRIGEPS